MCWTSVCDLGGVIGSVRPSLAFQSTQPFQLHAVRSGLLRLCYLMAEDQHLVSFTWTFSGLTPAANQVQHSRRRQAASVNPRRITTFAAGQLANHPNVISVISGRLLYEWG